MLRHLTRERRRLLQGLVVVAALLGGVLAEGLHSVLEPHTWCAVHEAMEHGGGEALGLPTEDGAHGEHGEHEPHAKHGAAQAKPLVATADPHLESLPETGDERHELCRLATLVDERGLPALSPHAPLGLARTRMVEPPRGVDSRFDPIEILRLAPKQSPPRV